MNCKMLRSLFALTAAAVLSVNAEPFYPRAVANSTTTRPSTITSTVVPVASISSIPASTSLTYEETTKYFTTVDGDGLSTVITGVFQLATTTRFITTTLSYLNTVVTYTETKTYPAQYPPDMINGIRCQYFSYQCPTSTVFTGPVGSLITQDSSISVSSYLSECSKTIDITSVTADASSTITTISYLPPTTLNGPPIETTITTVQTKPPESKVGCCGSCHLTYSNLDIFYFLPESWGTTRCIPVGGAAPTGNPNATITASGKTTAMAGTSFVNSNGFTFVSPSVYVGFTSVSGSNVCGQVGELHDNFTLGFAPGELSTEFRPLGGFGFGPAFATWPWDINSVICGDRPIIAFPDKLRTAIDPAWSICSANSGAEWQGNDPPFVLQPQSNIAVPTSSSSASIATPPAPEDTPTAAQPQITSQSSLYIDPSPTQVGAVPIVSSAAQPGSPQASDPPGNDSPAASPAQSNNPPAADPSQSPTLVITPATSTDSNGQIHTTSILSLAPASNPPDQDPGQAIASGIGVQPISPPTPAPAPAVITLGDGQVASVVDPGVVVIGTQTLSVGGRAVTIGGDVISIASGGSIVVDGSTSALPSAGPAEPSVAVIAPGTTLTAGGQAATINGVPYSLGSAGLVVGSSTMAFPGANGTGSGIATGSAIRSDVGWGLLVCGIVFTALIVT